MLTRTFKRLYIEIENFMDLLFFVPEEFPETKPIKCPIPPENKYSIEELKIQLQKNADDLKPIFDKFQQIKFVLDPKTPVIALLTKNNEQKFTMEEKAEPVKSILHDPTLLQNNERGNPHSLKNKIHKMMQEYPHIDAIKLLSMKKYRETAKTPKHYLDLCEIALKITTTLYDLTNKIQNDIAWHQYWVERSVENILNKEKRKEILSEPQQKLLDQTLKPATRETMKYDMRSQLETGFSKDPDIIISRAIIHLDSLLGHFSNVFKISFSAVELEENKMASTADMLQRLPVTATAIIVPPVVVVEKKVVPVSLPALPANVTPEVSAPRVVP